MTIRVRNPSVELPVDDLWTIQVQVTDIEGEQAEDTLIFTVTDPAGATLLPTVVDDGCGWYSAAVTVDAAGRWVAAIAGLVYGAAAATAYASGIVDAAGMPVLADVDEYLGNHSHSDDELQDALDAEAANQRKVCRVPAEYGADLRQALLRRVARNLAMRRQKLGLILPGDEGSDRASFIPRLDAEIRRFEGPYRRLKVG